jgi:hypothetical protein
MARWLVTFVTTSTCIGAELALLAVLRLRARADARALQA